MNKSTSHGCDLRLIRCLVIFIRNAHRVLKVNIFVAVFAKLLNYSVVTLMHTTFHFSPCHTYLLFYLSRQKFNIYVDFNY